MYNKHYHNICIREHNRILEDFFRAGCQASFSIGASGGHGNNFIVIASEKSLTANFKRSMINTVNKHREVLIREALIDSCNSLIEEKEYELVDEKNEYGMYALESSDRDKPYILLSFIQIGSNFSNVFSYSWTWKRFEKHFIRALNHAMPFLVEEASNQMNSYDDRKDIS